MFVLASWAGLIFSGHLIVTHVFGIKPEIDLHGILILLLIATAAIYRLIDRYPPSLFDAYKHQGRQTNRSKRIEYDFRVAEAKFPFRFWIRRQWVHLLDYYNIWQAVHEWKRERIARSLIETVYTEPKTLDGGMPEAEKLAIEKRKSISEDAYQTAESLLNAGRYLQSLEGIEQAVRMKCPDCNGTGFLKPGRLCDKCTKSWNQTVPRFHENNNESNSG